jgi:hypothetical protein
MAARLGWAIFAVCITVNLASDTPPKGPEWVESNKSDVMLALGIVLGLSLLLLFSVVMNTASLMKARDELVARADALDRRARWKK